MSRYAPRPTGMSYSFGPGPMKPAVKWLIISNIVLFLATQIYSPLEVLLGLIPEQVLKHGWIWQVATYMFIHGSPAHILFNMLAVWMFGVELERLWGTRFFLKYYAITGIGAGVSVIAVSLVPLDWTSLAYARNTIGASGAVFGVLLAFAYYFPDRPILMFLLFPIPAKYFVAIIGAIAFITAPNSQASETAHLGGLLFGYLYLRGGRGGLGAEIKYRYLKWKMNRLRRKFDVYSGGRSDWDRHVH
jgi:membrane associated rhomboid family serine protease